jgi:hypothetical protein
LSNPEKKYPSARNRMTQRQTPLPAFNTLPLQEGEPPNSAWGLWGDSKDTSLGSLNYLTDELVLRTTKEEVKTGERVGLEYGITYTATSTKIG